ncbi:MAG: SRPBCC domain-containing protein [Flavisolibacter sp.]
MQSNPLIKEALLDAPLHRVWKAITNNDDMKQWYFDLKEFKPEVGFQFQFYGENEGRKFLHLCEVKEVIENKKISYTWTYDTHPEAVTLVSWELFPEGNKTRLKLTHEGLDKLPQERDYAIDNFKAGWNDIVEKSLRNYVGVLEHSVDKSIEINAKPAQVWEVLTHPQHTKQWAEAFMPGIYVESDWEKGNEVMWKGADGNTFVKGIVLTNEKEKVLDIGFYDDPTMSDPGKIGKYRERFEFSEIPAGTNLKIHSGPVSKQDSREHAGLWDGAMNRIKEIAEK